jgi:hypothetical protein
MVYVIYVFSVCDVFAGFSGIFCAIFWSNREPDANESKKRNGGSKHKQTERRRAGREWGPAAGARVSAATQRTRTSDSGTDVCTTLSPRHGNVMADASGKGGSERDDSTVTMKPELNRFRV